MNKALTQYRRILASDALPKFKSADLASKIEVALKCLSNCGLCSRECGVDRTASEMGYCKVGNHMSVSSGFDHYGEEPDLVPSFTIFFLSCTLSCQFCQNSDISHVESTQGTGCVGEDELAGAIDAHSYCRNVNFVGGDPTPYLPFILKTLGKVNTDIPVVWNSNFYMSRLSMELLSDVVDIYLSDFKYGNDKCAERLSDAPDYSAIVKRNHLLAHEDSEMIIRHLILPSHVECCTIPILDFIAESFGDGVVVNIMDQYRPCFNAGDYPDIDRRITTKEFEHAVRHARELGLNFIT